MRAIFDTCILIDYLKGVDTAREVVDRAEEGWISIVTWLEIMAGAESGEERETVEAFLNSFNVQPLTRSIARQAVAVSEQLECGMAEAAIIATARVLEGELITWYPNPMGSQTPIPKELETKQLLSRKKNQR
jgi:predicted nucleic acid-binding protein